MSDHFLGVLAHRLDVGIQGLLFFRINLCWLSIELIIEYFWDAMTIQGDYVVCGDVILKNYIFISFLIFFADFSHRLFLNIFFSLI